MTFTGRIGTVQSQLGNIVLGVVDSFGLGTFGFEVHVLGPNRIRVLFSKEVTDSALSFPSYSLSTTAPATSVLPAIVGVKFYDETHRAVVLLLNQSLTTGVTYSVQCFGVGSVDGLGVTPTAKNFIANAPDPPRAVGAWQSTRGCVDILFDRTVSPYSDASTAKIRDASAAVGTGASMTQLLGEPNLPMDTLRFSYPVGIASANVYEIDLTDVVDSSLNESSPTVPLTLALRSPTPYDYAKLRQLQIVDAVVSDVSSDYLQGGMVRVFFNCPVGSSSTVDWVLTQNSPHPVDSTAHTVVSPDAFDLATLLTLMNELKAKFNLHLTEEQVHLRDATPDLVTSATAVDIDTANTMIDELQVRFSNHKSRSGVHFYVDVLHSVGYISMDSGFPALSYSMANNLKAAFNGHILTEFPVSITSVFQDISAITHYDSPAGGSCTGIVSPFCLYAEIIYNRQSSPDVRIFIKAALTSEDSGSTTNPLDYTGSIEARSASAPAQVKCVTCRLDGPIELELDREIDVSGSLPVVVTGPSSVHVDVTSVSRFSTIAHTRWLFKQIVTAYRWHIDPAQGAGHTGPISWIMGSTELPGPSLDNLIEKANVARGYLIGHMSSDMEHHHKDPLVDRFQTVPEATNFDSLVNLVSSMKEAFNAHNRSVGPHDGQGYVIVSAPLMTVLRVNSRSVVDEGLMGLSGQVRTRYRDNSFGGGSRPAGDDRYGSVSFDLQFKGLATRPSVASAIARAGVQETSSGPVFESDAVQVFFTKPMHQIPLSPSNLTVSGGSIIQKDASWVAPDVAVIRVSNMQVVSYTITSSGLTDPSGNPTL